MLTGPRCYKNVDGIEPKIVREKIAWLQSCRKVDVGRGTVMMLTMEVICYFSLDFIIGRKFNVDSPGRVCRNWYNYFLLNQVYHLSGKV